MIGTFIFAGIIVFIIVLYVRYERWVKAASPPIADPERFKCESPIERRLYDSLKARGEYVLTQVPCGKYRIDIALPAYHIAIECDGKAYHSGEKEKAHDKRKNAYLRANGWKVLRFPGSRINRDLRGILVRIEKTKGKHGETEHD